MIKNRDPRRLRDIENKAVIYIKEYSEKEGFAPCYREIAQELGYKSLNAINNLMHKLRNKGRINFDHGRDRSITLCVQKDEPGVFSNLHNKSEPQSVFAKPTEPA